MEKAKANRKLDEEAEQAAADAEPMGSVAAAVPRDAGSAAGHDECADSGSDVDSAPSHEGGHATIVAGEEAHKAENPPSRKLPDGQKPSA